MGQYRTPIVTGDRVALAPHTDLWMAGIRFGTVEEVWLTHDGFLRYTVRITHDQVFIAKHDDLLGAVAGTPVGGSKGAMPSTEGPGARIVGGMEPRHEMRTEYPMCSETDNGVAHVNDDNPGQPMCRTCTEAQPEDEDVRDWMTGWTP